MESRARGWSSTRTWAAAGAGRVLDPRLSRRGGDGAACPCPAICGPGGKGRGRPDRDGPGLDYTQYHRTSSCGTGARRPRTLYQGRSHGSWERDTGRLPGSGSPAGLQSRSPYLTLKSLSRRPVARPGRPWGLSGAAAAAGNETASAGQAPSRASLTGLTLST